MSYSVPLRRATALLASSLALIGGAAAAPATAVSSSAGGLSGYAGVERIAETQDSAAVQAQLDAWTPEAMRAAVSADNTPAAATLRQTQPKPAESRGKSVKGAPTGPIKFASAAPAAPLSAPGRVPGAHPMATSAPTNGLPSVGALFFDVGPVHERCTATVISTGARNVIATAGHCLYQKPVSWLPSIPMPNPVFVPGYHDGQAPYGKWSVKSRYVASAWKNSANPDYDYGFFVLNDSNGQHIQDVVGANGWRTDAGYTNSVEVTGYPDNRDQPLQCFTDTRRQAAYQLVFPCDSFHTGVSGALLMTDFGRSQSQQGTAIASLGGYQQGGNTDNISYAVLWNGNTASLINAAISGQ